MAKNYVCDGAKIECKLCTKPEGTLVVTSNTVKVQDKNFATANDNQKMNLLFQGNCVKSPFQASPCLAVIAPGSWQGTADLIVQDAPALLESSVIMCNYGGVPITITDDLQVSELTELAPTDVAGVAPDMPMSMLIKEHCIVGGKVPSRRAVHPLTHKKIKKGWWTDVNNKKITEAVLEDVVRFHVETTAIADGETLNITLKDWAEWYNQEDYPEGVPTSLSICANKGFVEFTLPKSWETDIKEDCEEAIELYFDIAYEGKQYEFPMDSEDYLKVPKRARVILVFYKGGPLGNGKMYPEKEAKELEGIGIIYQNTLKYIKEKNMGAIGGIIAPSVTQNPGIKTGKEFIEKKL